MLQAAAEKEITLHQDNVRAYAEQISQLRRENSEALLRSEQNGKRIAEVRTIVTFAVRVSISNERPFLSLPRY